MRNALVRTTLLATVLSISGLAHAIPFTATPNDADRQLDSSGSLANGDMKVGKNSGNTSTAILVFELPNYGANTDVLSAELTAFRESRGGSGITNSNVDLYGVRTASLADVLLSDIAGGTLLEDNFDVATGGGTGMTRSSTSSALVDWLEDQLLIASPGDYVFFRLEPDNPGGISGNNANYLYSDTGQPNEPTLSFEAELSQDGSAAPTVPEPATVTLGALAVTMLAARRRR